MLLPVFENDFVLAKVLPIGTVLNNITTTVAIAKADALWLCKDLLRKVWNKKIAFIRLNIDHPELLPVGPHTVVPDNIALKGVGDISLNQILGFFINHGL